MLKKIKKQLFGGKTFCHVGEKSDFCTRFSTKNNDINN